MNNDIIPFLLLANSNKGIKTIRFHSVFKKITLFHKIMHIIFCGVHYFQYLCTKF